jgi:hypothetical protein
MKYTGDRPFADPEKSARRLMQHAHAFEVVQDGRIYVEDQRRSYPATRARLPNIRRALPEGSPACCQSS